jgi:hypothetical protein
MNQRIRELAVAAAPANSSIPHSEWNIPKEFIEKFAELIVKDCLQMADEFEIDVNRSGLVDRMKYHFGLDK